ncbi:transposase [Flavobacterium kingsejongi]|uniref:Transposase n=1 Tax=Flavobacterium kingsejongi TaxID=1678728 RepID=A0A2S1LMR6_9FLAO|nr:transposase [Flavobacterium kingsejongi]AWG24916.1 hypothetical protein FK004_06560 [Flavobacterium kingsejongi]
MERKIKYSYEFKLRCIEEVLKENLSAESVAKKYGFDKSNLTRWLGFYNKYGTAGLQSRRNQIYTSTFKLKVLRTIKRKSISLNEACLSFNIPNASVIVSWQKRFEKLGNTGLVDKPKGRPNMAYKRAKKKSNKPLTREEELLLENESLRAQVDYLKKLQALIQAEEAVQNRKQKP